MQERHELEAATAYPTLFQLLYEVKASELIWWLTSADYKQTHVEVRDPEANDSR